MNTGGNKDEKMKSTNCKWQNECLKRIQGANNVILSAPTGSGKTRVFLEWAKQKKQKPVIITAPIKALSNQRYRELLAQGFTVGLETGDIKILPDNCDFICCTQEIYTNKYVQLEEATVIMDEFHYIFENQDRARTYIDALHNSKAKNLLLCSATFGNIDDLRSYVEKVSGRTFLNYETSDRLTSLSYNSNIDVEEIENSLVFAFSRRNIDFILDRLSVNREEQEDKNAQIAQLAQEFSIDNPYLIEYAKRGLAGYYGALLPKEKLFIEKCFEEGLIDTVVGTDALALGVNFPVKNVVFCQLSKFYDGPISKNLFEQLAGRAGRKGYYDEGFVYYCSQLGAEAEARGYDTQQLYQKLLDAENENISIVLNANIKDILSKRTTVEEEVRYISEFSTEPINEDEVREGIEDDVRYIQNSAFDDNLSRYIIEQLESEGGAYYYDEDGTLKETDKALNLRRRLEGKRQEFSENIARVYFPEYSPKENCQIFTDILFNSEPREVLWRYGTGNKTFYQILQFRKYVRSLPKKYRKGLTQIDDIVREIDSTAIDGYRGSLDTGTIAATLNEANKFEGNRVNRVLNNIKKGIETDIEEDRRINNG